MTESSHPAPPIPLSPSGRRALAGTMVYTALGQVEMLTAHLVDVLDAVSWALLGTAGLTPAEARVVLATLWTDR